ncbi:MAG TPA: hypothetical protein VJ777_29500 [Mycobacterium sp.]|nr:hypothetical protein [Mycobacterium sp.]
MAQRLSDEIRTLLGWPGTPVVVTAFEAPVTVFAVVDEDQYAYRLGNAVGALADMQLLDRLLDVPYVDVGDDSPARDRDGAQLVRDRGRSVRSPVRLTGAVVCGGSWDRAATALGAFVTIAPRVAVVSKVSDRVRAEAGVYGIGLVLSDGARLVSEPLPAVAELGPFQWYVAELVYEQWLKQSPTRVPGQTPGTAADQGQRSEPTPPRRRYTAA